MRELFHTHSYMIRGSPSFELPFYLYLAVTIFIGNLFLRTILETT